MFKSLTRIALALIKGLGVCALFLGLALFAAHHYLVGVLVFLLGLSFLGFCEMGWAP